MENKIINYNTRTGNINANASSDTVEMYLVPVNSVSKVLTYSVTSNPALDGVNRNQKEEYEAWCKYLKGRLRLALSNELFNILAFREIEEEGSGNIEFRCDFTVNDLNK